jgi:flavodoxin
MSTAIVYYSMLGNSEMIVYHIIYNIVNIEYRLSNAGV